MRLLLVRMFSSKFCQVCFHSQTHPLIAYLTKSTSIGLDVLGFFHWGKKHHMLVPLLVPSISLVMWIIHRKHGWCLNPNLATTLSWGLYFEECHPRALSYMFTSSSNKVILILLPLKISLFHYSTLSLWVQQYYFFFKS
jgi:hypothetical protein